MHKMQYLIGTGAAPVNADWQTVKINAGFLLMHCSELRVEQAVDADGISWWLMGIAVHSDRLSEDPLTVIKKARTSEIKEHYKTWNGRWLLIGNDEIHLDCSGLIGCFYTLVNGRKWVSGSLALLQEIEGLVPRPEVLKHRRGVEWYPLPLSRFEGVYKLLPSQTLNLQTFQPVYRPLPKPIPELSYPEVLDRIQDRFITSLSNLYQTRKRILLPLTSGYDSRLIAAACHTAKISFATYTQDHKHLTLTDFDLPPKIARALQVKHQYIKKGPFSAEKERLYTAHTAGNIDDADKEMFTHGQWDHFGKGDLILRGGVFGVAKCFGYNWFDPPMEIASLRKRYRLPHDEDNFYIQALKEWMKWVEHTPTEGLDWRDRFYLEQRVGGWLSAIEQSLDLRGTERFYIINSHEIISLFYSIPEAKRRTSQAHIDLIERMVPALLQYAFNTRPTGYKSLMIQASKATTMSLPQLYQKFREKFFAAN